MEVTLVQREESKKLQLPAKRRITDIIGAQGLNGETFVIKLNDRLAHPDERLKEGDVLEFVEIIYGG